MQNIIIFNELPYFNLIHYSKVILIQYILYTFKYTFRGIPWYLNRIHIKSLTKITLRQCTDLSVSVKSENRRRFQNVKCIIYIYIYTFKREKGKFVIYLHKLRIYLYVIQGNGNIWTVQSLLSDYLRTKLCWTKKYRNTT